MEFLSDSPEMNLYSQLMVLSDLRYKTPADQDDMFFHAKNGADISLMVLRRSAQDGKKEADRILTALLKVRFMSNSRLLSFG